MSLRKVQRLSLVQQTVETLREMINSGAYDNVDRLPSEEQLAAEIGASRLTVREALAVLEGEGVIMRRHGKGTMINYRTRQLKARIDPAREIGRFIAESGFQPGVARVKGWWEPAGVILAKKLGLKPEDKVLVIEKLFLADGNPAVFCIDRIPEKLIKTPIPEARYWETIFTVLEEHSGIHVVSDIVELIPTTADHRLAAIMKVNPGTPLLQLDTVAFDEQNEPVMATQEYYLDTFVRFTLYRKANY
ncbi:GntR family transcriptional regulator [Moorella sulfitireducens]|uniref:GntR family transcriptional regulator n=1 Tax=Neomoorella sulfitireducens TaxID=2972948 RepID=UPI0021ACF79F|nr:GntR family transcriptional regulator [Moorella sulfitireducens]